MGRFYLRYPRFQSFVSPGRALSARYARPWKRCLLMNRPTKMSSKMS